MYKIGVIALIILPFIFFDWHGRMVFLARAYPRRYGHGKSWNRVHKHYKANWRFYERLLWIPMFKEHYEDKYKLIAYFSYAHFLLSIVTVAVFFISVDCFPSSKFWIYEFAGYTVFWIIRFIYDNAIARGHI